MDVWVEKQVPLKMFKEPKAEKAVAELRSKELTKRLKLQENAMPYFHNRSCWMR